MKTRTANKMAMAGAGIALALFGVFGLQPGAFIGGIMGVNLAGHLLGLPVVQTLAARLIIGAGMFVAVLATGLMFATVGATLGYLSGLVADLTKVHREHVKADHALSH